MRIEVSGANLTGAVISIIEDYQTQPELVGNYIETIDAICRRLTVDEESDDGYTDADTMHQLRTLLFIRRDLQTLASPPDIDDPADDTPAAQL